MKNNILTTLVFCAYRSHAHIYRICKSVSRKFKIIVIENSLDYNFKKSIEKKFKNTKVIIPKKNIGLSKSYNIGIKNSNTKYVFLNCPDVVITNNLLNRLTQCAEALKEFDVLAPEFKNTLNFSNYFGNKKEFKSKKKLINQFKLSEVEFIDNGFFMKTSFAKKFLFDEKFFLYFEVTDFCTRLRKNNKRLLISDKIRFHHFHSKSVEKKYEYIAKLTKAWHFNWSKFYYLSKHKNYFYALYKIKNNFFSAIKKLLVNFLKLRFKECYINLIEIYGIIFSICMLKASYRPHIK